MYESTCGAHGMRAPVTEPADVPVPCWRPVMKQPERSCTFPYSASRHSRSARSATNRVVWTHPRSLGVSGYGPTCKPPETCAQVDVLRYLSVVLRQS